MWLTGLILLVLTQISNAKFTNRNDERHAVHNNREWGTTVIADEPENCVFVTSETGYFTYKSTNKTESVCGIYLMTDPQNVVEITFVDFDVPCNNENGAGNLVQYLDGWELNGEVFPNSASISSSIEQNEFCSENQPSSNRVFISSQNGALISYRISEVGKGFTIFIKHRKHSFPCNIIHIDEPFFILKNYRTRMNCSIWAPYPTSFKFNSYSVGNLQTGRKYLDQCSDSGDRIEIGGGGLDTNHFEILDAICNKSNFHGVEETIYCPTATIKLVSSGNHENYINVSMRSITPDQSLNLNEKYQCSLSSIK